MTIAVSGLCVRYGAVEAVRGVSFRVEAGEICGYLGPNGAGKSSTVKVLSGISPPASGSVEVCGFDLVSQKTEAQRRLGYVPENAAAYPLLTASELLELVGELYELPEDTLAEKRERLLSLFELSPVASRPIATLSKGQRQRLVLLSALLHDPDVLILDEPFTGLDVNAARTVKELIQGLAAEGRTVLLSSHSLEIVERLCHRVIVIDQGRVVADAPVAELVSLAKAGSLEEVFRALTGAPKESEAASILEALRPGTGLRTAFPP